MRIRSEIAELFRLAAEATASLVELAGRPPAAGAPRFGPLFRRLRDRLVALPVPQDTYALLLNKVADAEALIAQSECGAARWQLRQTMRRLDRLGGDWADEAGTAGGVSPRFGTRRRSVLRKPLGGVGPGRA